MLQDFQELEKVNCCDAIPVVESAQLNNMNAARHTGINKANEMSHFFCF